MPVPGVTSRALDHRPEPGRGRRGAGRATVLRRAVGRFQRQAVLRLRAGLARASSASSPCSASAFDLADDFADPALRAVAALAAFASLASATDTGLDGLASRAALAAFTDA